MEVRLRAAGQEHLLEHLRNLEPDRRPGFLRELEGVDWDRVRAMHRAAGPAADHSAQPEMFPVRASEPTPDTRRSLREAGLSLLASGRAAFVLMAGGQGSRLGFDGPKGAAPLGLPGNLTLFEVVVRRLLRLEELSGTLPPFSVMTGPDNDEATRRWFRARTGPTVPEDWPSFFLQSSAPALDDAGHALLAAPGRLALVPDGNGGIWERLRDTGLLLAWRARGIEWIHVAGVDNLLSLPCDPVFLGHAAAAGQPLSCKSVLRTDPAEKVGVHVQDAHGRPRVAEYTELPARTASALDTDGLPVHREANIASHLVRLDLAESFADLDLPWHLARKRIPHVDPITGEDRSGEIACKYERFLFDAFPASPGNSLLRVRRESEFAPVKNAEGPDSPATARQALEALHRSWRERWGEADNTSWVDPLESFDGEPPALGRERS
ncbi:MAG TPA: UTP--glucose-1-phosphate uridylyltransferase [Fibrobacteria bacterium]|nr:UTP--glucose-1-phosphate uridylyltransferase [Fibrobacteria bacterium]